MTATDQDEPLPDAPRKGRGTVSNRAGRFEPADRFRADDGWGTADEELPPLRTTVSADSARRVITTNDSPDVGFDQSINPYRGCEHRSEEHTSELQSLMRISYAVFCMQKKLHPNPSCFQLLHYTTT